MFCPKCGTKLSENEDFCSNCGFNILEVKNQTNRNNDHKASTMVESLSKKSEKVSKPIKAFFEKNKKTVFIGFGFVILIITGIVLFNKFYDFTKINWDKENGDYNIEYTEPAVVNLNVIATDKEKNKITDISFSTDSGEIEANGSSVKWTLPKKVGSYTIVAKAPSGKKITKTIKVIDLEGNNWIPKPYNDEEDKDSDDNDNDGLTNEEEKNYKTNKNSADTDGDGLLDSYEIKESKTDPLKNDTDGDGLRDGDELDLGLDPLKSDSKGDGIKDGNRNLTYELNDKKTNIHIKINGKGNIASTTIDKIKNTTFSNKEGLLDIVYNFYSTGTIESATVEIPYSLDEIKNKGLNEDNLVLYYFNNDTKVLEEMPTTVDKNNKKIIVNLKHFSMYVIGDKNKVIKDIETQIMFVIDNSISMYSEDQMIKAGYNDSVGAVGNDTSFKRLSLTNKIIDMFTGNYKFGVAEFSGNYVNLNKFTNEKSELKKSVNSMKSKWNSNATGTNIISALNSGISEFDSSDTSNHYLIMLTDGKNTKGTLSYNKKSIISNAKEKDIKICIIGLGSEIDTKDLTDIAEQTGCKYYNASNSSGLDEIYSIIGSDINYSLVDTDNDGKVDGMVIADSGFLVNRDGFSFANYTTTQSSGGTCYGMATFAMLYYLKKLPIKLEYLDNSKFITGEFKYVKLISNGYDLSNSYFEKGGNLYDFKFKNDVLNIYFNSEKPADYRDRVENDTLMIKKEYYDMFDKIGSDFVIREYKLKDKDFSKYQNVLINIESEKLKNSVSKEEYGLLNAIWRLYILQANHKKKTFSADPDDAFSLLYEKILNKIPVTIGVYGGHEINAMKLIQDINDSNKFKIEVYDNNYIGQSQYIEMTRTKFNKVTWNFTAWTNEYSYNINYNEYKDTKVEVHIPDIQNFE